jgi:Bacteriophage probable baseplate hub protein
MSDADIAARIAAEHGLRSEVGETPPRSATVFQHNESDLEFLRRRAARIGFEVDVEDDILRFLPAADPNGDASLSIAGLRAPVRFLTTDVPGPLEVTVLGWDPVKKGPIVARASGDAGQSGPGESLAFDRGDVLSEEPLLSEGLLFSQTEADAVAQATLQRLTGKSTTLEGETDGDPRFRPRAIVEVTGMGERLDGRYFVARATHRFAGGGGYVTLLRLRRDAEKP